MSLFGEEFREEFWHILDTIGPGVLAFTGTSLLLCLFIFLLK